MLDFSNDNNHFAFLHHFLAGWHVKRARLSPTMDRRVTTLFVLDWFPLLFRNETSALERMPRGRLEYLKRLIPLLGNQSEDCLYLNIFAPLQSEFTTDDMHTEIVN